MNRVNVTNWTICYDFSKRLNKKEKKKSHQKKQMKSS